MASKWDVPMLIDYKKEDGNDGDSNSDGENGIARKKDSSGPAERIRRQPEKKQTAKPVQKAFTVMHCGKNVIDTYPAVLKRMAKNAVAKFRPDPKYPKHVAQFEVVVLNVPVSPPLEVYVPPTARGRPGRVNLTTFSYGWNGLAMRYIPLLLGSEERRRHLNLFARPVFETDSHTGVMHLQSMNVVECLVDTVGQVPRVISENGQGDRASEAGKSTLVRRHKM